MASGCDDSYQRRLRGAEYLKSRQHKARIIARICRNELARANRIADMGAGTGIVKATLERELGKPIVGFELVRKIVREGQGMVVADALQLPVRDESFDFVILNHVYEHAEDQEGLFAAVFRILAPGGLAYVSAGSRHAIIEPHYRLPFLSWLPKGSADRYLRLTGRGRAYEGIRFLTHGELTRVMGAAGFRVVDITRRTLDDLLAGTRGWVSNSAWNALRRLPDPAIDRSLALASPQWFFLLEKPA